MLRFDYGTSSCVQNAPVYRRGLGQGPTLVSWVILEWVQHLGPFLGWDLAVYVSLLGSFLSSLLPVTVIGAVFFYETLSLCPFCHGAQPAAV